MDSSGGTKVGEIYYDLNLNTSGFEAGVARAKSQAMGFGDSLTMMASATGRLGTMMTMAITLPVAAAAAGALKLAGDFEKSLNILQSVTGATGGEMAKLRQLAIDLGNDMTLPGISAKDAAAAMTELAKAGLSVNNVLSASHGVLSLAKAGQLEVADAALITARALNAFELSGDKANDIADLLAAGANASSASVEDMALGLQMAGASAHTMGISLNDTITAISLFSNAGIRGSDAGTSLKQMFIQLATPTKQAGALMSELNLHFFDAKGNFIGLEKTAGMLQERLSGLSVEERNHALAIIFGSDAMRVAAILAQSGADGFDNLSKAVNRSGAAADLAAAQNKGFNGALDNLKSTAETAGIEIGTKLLPALTQAFKGLADKVNAVSSWFQGLSETQQKLIGETILYLAVLGPLLKIFSSLIGTVMTLGKLLAGMSGVLRAGGLLLGRAGLAAGAAEATGAIAGGGGLLAALTGPVGLGVALTALAGFGIYEWFHRFKAGADDAKSGIMAFSSETGKTGGSVSALTLFTNALVDAQNRAKTATSEITTLQQIAAPTTEATRAATQRVADAQNAVNNALAIYGANSPQYVSAVAQLRAAQDDLNNKTNTGIGNALNLIIKKGQLRDANNDAARASANLAGWQDIVNGKLGTGIHLAGQLTNAVLGIAPAVNSLQGSIAVLQRNVGAAVQAVGSLQFQAQSGFSLQGARAGGGPVTAGSNYLVGEMGPEIFVPNVSGTIIPADRTAAISGGITTNLYGDINVAKTVDAAPLLRRMGLSDKLVGQGLSAL